MVSGLTVSITTLVPEVRRGDNLIVLELKVFTAEMSQINPLKSNYCRRTASLETVTPHHKIAERKLDGKREAYRARNDLYVKAMYGNPQEKEEVR